MKTLYALTSLFCLISAAAAQSTAFVDPGFEGTTQHSEWDIFTHPSGGVNVPDSVGTVGEIRQTSGNAIITSTANIYSPARDMTFSLTADSPEPLGMISLQYRLWGQGNAFLGTTLLLNGGETVLQPDSSEQVYYQEGESGFGDTIDQAMHYQWDVSQYDVTSYEIQFVVLIHNSLDQVRLDTVTRVDDHIELQAPEVLSTTLVDGQPTVTFTTVSGQSYQLEASGDGATWSAIGTEVAGDGETQSLSDATYAGTEVRYYRVIAR
ncbi:MAG: hypothetical protein Q7P63_02910 [Verrucomicrobiota bacterium JB022]|nr:hypothetical protein [Verrucomicrobiota bacterium JB022]